MLTVPPRPPLADDEDHRDLADRMFAHLVIDLLVAEIGLGAQSCLAQQVTDFQRVGVAFRRDGGHDNLRGCEP
jgi:hypothetical protein